MFENDAKSRQYYKCWVQYKGSRYRGWQIQLPGTPTIQGELLSIYQKLAHTEDIKLIGASRTDTGVHAKGQIFRLDLPHHKKLPLSAITKGANALLTSDIRVFKAEYCTEKFHPIRQAKRKEYRYYFHLEEITPPFMDEFMAKGPKLKKEEKIDWNLIRDALKILVGTHNFQNFYCLGSDISSTIRTIYECELVHTSEMNKSDPFEQLLADYYVFRFVGSGFLKQMVRLLVGCLWNIGLKKVDLEQFRSALKGELPPLEKLGKVAPGQGLYLHSIDYE